MPRHSCCSLLYRCWESPEFSCSSPTSRWEETGVPGGNPPSHRKQVLPDSVGSALQPLALSECGTLLTAPPSTIGNLFGGNRLTVITLFNGAYASSAVVFVVIKLFHEVGLSLRAMFLFISCLLALVILRTIFLLPRAHIPHPLPEGYTYRVNCALGTSMDWRSRQERAGVDENLAVRGERMQGDVGERRGVLKGEGGADCKEAEVEVRGRRKGTGEEMVEISPNTGERRVGMEEAKKDGASSFEKPNGEKERGAGERTEDIDLEEFPQVDEESTRGKTPDNVTETKTGAVEAEGNVGESREPPTDGENFQPSGPEASVAQEKEEEEVITYWSCIFSRLFLTNIVWLSLIQLRLLLFIGTLNPMLQFLAQGDPSNVSKLTNAFGIIQLCGFLCAPWNGLIMDRHRHKRKKLGSSPDSPSSERLEDMQSAVLSLAITVILAVLFSISATIPMLEVQYLTFILQTFTRAFLYSGNSAFLALAFPMCHFGKLLGTTMALAAVVSLLQFPCFIFINGTLQGNPLYINIACIGLVTVAFAHPVALCMFCRHESHRGTRETNRNAKE